MLLRKIAAVIPIRTSIVLHSPEHANVIDNGHVTTCAHTTEAGGIGEGHLEQQILLPKGIHVEKDTPLE